MSFSTVTTLVVASPLHLQPPTPPTPGGGCPPGAAGALCNLGSAIAGAAGDAVGAVAGDAAASAFDSIVQQLSQGVGKAVGLMMSFWMKIPIPSLGGGSSAVDRLHSATLYLTVITAVISLFFAAGKAALATRSASAEAAEEAGKGLARIVVASVVIVPAVILASQAADQYSAWLVDQAAGGNVDTAIAKLSGIPQALGIGFTFILALLALAASIVQAFLILIRDALLILLVGALPLAAAASITGAGRQTWTKLIGWLIAFIVFKPVAAMVYATALWSVTDTTNPMNQVAGLFLVILAVFTLPALMRLIVPQVERVGSGGGVSLLAGAAAGAAGASGAKEHLSGRGGGSSSSGGGAPGKASFTGEHGASGASGAGGSSELGGPGGPTGSGGPAGAGSPQGGGAGGGGAGGGGGAVPVGAGAAAGGGGGAAAGGATSSGGAGGGGIGAGTGAVVGAGAAAAHTTYDGAKQVGGVSGSAAEGAVDGH